jgi:hypothetical protein
MKIPVFLRKSLSMTRPCFGRDSGARFVDLYKGIYSTISIIEVIQRTWRSKVYIVSNIMHWFANCEVQSLAKTTGYRGNKLTTSWCQTQNQVHTGLRVQLTTQCPYKLEEISVMILLFHTLLTYKYSTPHMILHTTLRRVQLGMSHGPNFYITSDIRYPNESSGKLHPKRAAHRSSAKGLQYIRSYHLPFLSPELQARSQLAIHDNTLQSPMSPPRRCAAVPYTLPSWTSSLEDSPWHHGILISNCSHYLVNSHGCSSNSNKMIWLLSGISGRSFTFISNWLTWIDSGFFHTTIEIHYYRWVLIFLFLYWYLLAFQSRFRNADGTSDFLDTYRDALPSMMSLSGAPAVTSGASLWCYVESKEEEIDDRVQPEACDKMDCRMVFTL